MPRQRDTVGAQAVQCDPLVQPGGYATELQARIEPISVWSYLSDLHNAVFRMIPEADWSWLRDIVNRLHRHMPSTSVTTSRRRNGWCEYSVRLLRQHPHS